MIDIVMPAGENFRLGLAALLDVLSAAWSAETSSYDDFDATRPSKGQCAVTAMIVQDHFGGELLRVVNAGDSHYFNRLPDGCEVDLTRDQFDVWDPSPVEVRDRSYVDGHAATLERYRVLCERSSGPFVLAVTYVTGPDAGSLGVVGPFADLSDALLHRDMFGPAHSSIVPAALVEPAVSVSPLEHVTRRPAA